MSEPSENPSPKSEQEQNWIAYRSIIPAPIRAPPKEKPKEKPPQQETPTCSFGFQLKHAAILKVALAALTDYSFNPEGHGFIKVGPDGMEIRVLNIHSRVLGYLDFWASGIKNFLFKKHFHKMANLDQMRIDLDNYGSENLIDIQHVQGSDQLDVVIGGEVDPREFEVDLVEHRDDTEKIPVITHSYEALVDCADFRNILNHVERATSKTVLFDIDNSKMRIKVEDQKWIYDCKKISKLKPVTKHRAKFQWPHCESLKTASFLSRKVRLCLITDPPHCMMLRFSIPKLGEMVFVKGEALIQPHVITGNNEIPNKSKLSFISRICLAGKLIGALNALSYLCYDQHDSGTFEVSPEKMRIATALNSEVKILGLLSLAESVSIDFSCKRSIDMKIVDFTNLYLKASTANEDDDIIICHVDGSNDLHFEFGRLFPTRFGLKLHERNSSFGDIPSIIFGAEVEIPSADLRQILHHVESCKSRLVYFYLAMGCVCINVDGIKRGWLYKYENLDARTELINHPMNFRILMPRYPHCTSLKAASFLAERCLMGLLTVPSNCVLFQFNISQNFILEYAIGENIKLPNFQSLKHGLEQNPEASKATEMISKFKSKKPLTPKKSFDSQFEAPSNLIDAVEALMKLNSASDTTATGIIEVDPQGMEIVTAVNTDTKVLGCLMLTRLCMFKFNYWKPVEKKMVDLNHILDNLSEAKYQMIGIHHIDGSNELSFTFGRAPSTRSYSLELHDTNADVKMIPQFTPACEAAVPSEDLRQIIQHIEDNKSETASFHMRDGTMSIKIDGKEWAYKSRYVDENVTRLDVSLPQLPYYESLRKASLVNERISWYVMTDPFKCIMLEMNIQRLGYLVYIVAEKEVLPKFELGNQSSSDIDPPMDKSGSLQP